MTTLTQGTDMTGAMLLVGDLATAPDFDVYGPGRIECFILRPEASRNVEREGFTPNISDIWVHYKETSDLHRLLCLHESWVKGPHPLERLAQVAE